MFSNQSTLTPWIGPGTTSHLAALALLGTVFICGASLFVALVLLLSGRGRASGRVATIAPALLAFYAVALIGVSLLSLDREYGPGEEKYFCDLDCHLAYSVIDVRSVSSLGDHVSAPPAHGRYWVVTVRARFDSTTIAPWRSRDVALTPNPRELILFDRSGRAYRASAAAQVALERAGAARSPLSRALIPGESSLTRVVFDVPSGAEPARVLLRDTELFNLVVIGHEGSFLHGQASWGL